MTNDTSARSAREIIAAHDQMHRAEAAIDAIHAPLPDEYVTATMGTDAWCGDPDETPVADSPTDVTTRAVNLDGDGVAYIEHIEGRVEMVVKMRGRLQVALILSPGEAGEIGRALSPLTVGDYWDLCDRLGTGGQR